MLCPKLRPKRYIIYFVCSTGIALPFIPLLDIVYPINLIRNQDSFLRALLTILLVHTDAAPTYNGATITIQNHGWPNSVDTVYIIKGTKEEASSIIGTT